MRWMATTNTIKTWAENNFANAALGDKRLSRRAVQIAASIAANPSASVPRQCRGAKTEIAGTYRFLSNDAINPHQVISAHRELTLEHCRRMPLVLCVQDGTELDYTGREADGMDDIGNGTGKGLMMQSVLAVSPEGELIGVLHLDIHKRKKKSENETVRQRQQRETERQIWTRSARAIAPLNFGPARIVHVCDRDADCFDFLDACRELKHDYVVRAQHDRKAREQTRLWEHLQNQPVAHEYTQRVPKRKQGKRLKGHRQATLSVRYAKVTFPPPINDPRYAKKAPVELWAVQAIELNPPEGHEAVEWMLLTTLRVENAQEALEVIGYYEQRWKIEEWHRSLKQGCAVEEAQMKKAQTLANQVAMKAVVAVRLIQMRDAARQEDKEREAAKRHVESNHLSVVALMLGKPEEQISVGEYWRQMAKLGGWLGRKNDGAPGWLTIWRGWQQIELMAQGFALAFAFASKKDV